jgi:hypothetical protein
MFETLRAVQEKKYQFLPIRYTVNFTTVVDLSEVFVVCHVTLYLSMKLGICLKPEPCYSFALYFTSPEIHGFLDIHLMLGEQPRRSCTFRTRSVAGALSIVVGLC